MLEPLLDEDAPSFEILKYIAHCLRNCALITLEERRNFCEKLLDVDRQKFRGCRDVQIIRNEVSSWTMASDEDQFKAILQRALEHLDSPNEEATEVFTFGSIYEVRLRLGDYESCGVGGLRVWPSARHLCSWLVSNNQELFSGEQEVLELGAGVGLCGILVSKFSGVRRTILSDNKIPLLKVLEANVVINSAPDTVVAVQRIDWTEEAQALQQPESIDTFDVVIGADLLYDDGAAELLHATVVRRLRPGGTVILCGPVDRADGGWQTYSDLMQGDAFSGGPVEDCQEYGMHTRVFLHRKSA